MAKNGLIEMRKNEIPNREDNVDILVFVFLWGLEKTCTKKEPFLFRNVVYKQRMVAKRTGSRQ